VHLFEQFGDLRFEFVIDLCKLESTDLELKVRVPFRCVGIGDIGFGLLHLR
jgi:hypothetical protein